VNDITEAAITRICVPAVGWSPSAHSAALMTQPFAAYKSLVVDARNDAAKGASYAWRRPV
jgi:hypothetical protein